MRTITRQPDRRPKAPGWHARFLDLLPAIRRYALIAFRQLRGEARDEAVQETIANAFVAYARLVERRRGHLAFPTVLARFAVAQIHAGRRVGTRLNIGDILSPYARRRQQIVLQRLNHFDRHEAAWREVVVEDRRAGPTETAAMRIDFAAWLGSLPDRRRRIAELLATGESTGETAQQFGVTAGRVSQLRRELKDSWDLFVSC